MHRYVTEIYHAALLLLVHSVSLILSFHVCLPLVFADVTHTTIPQTSVSHIMLKSMQF